MPEITVGQLFIVYQIAARKRSEIAASIFRNEKTEGNYGQQLVATANTEELLLKCNLRINVPERIYKSIIDDPDMETVIKSRQ